MTSESIQLRQWVTLRNSSMDLRVGCPLMEEIAHTLKSSLGRPHACALVIDSELADEFAESRCVDFQVEGFATKLIRFSASPRLGLNEAADLAQKLAEAQITADDLLVVMGNTQLLSLAGFVAVHWYGHLSLALVPSTASAALVGAVKPQALGISGAPDCFEFDSSARFEFVDIDFIRAHSSQEDLQYAYALLVATFVAENEKDLAELWDRAELLVQNDDFTLAELLHRAIKARGRMICSTSIAARQAILYGEAFARALREVSKYALTQGQCLAEALRFSARLACALEKISVDDVLTQDDLLDQLGLNTGLYNLQTQEPIAVDPEEFIAVLERERFRRSHRLMMAIPEVLGRVRLTALETEVLHEHVGAWVSAQSSSE